MELVERTRDDTKDNVHTVLACLRVCSARILRLACSWHEYISQSIAPPGSKRWLVLRARSPARNMHFSLPVCSLLCTLTFATSMLLHSFAVFIHYLCVAEGLLLG